MTRARMIEAVIAELIYQHALGKLNNETGIWHIDGSVSIDLPSLAEAIDAEMDAIIAARGK